MTYIHDVKLSLTETHVLRMQGIRSATAHLEKFTALSKELLDTVHYQSLLKPSIAHELFPVVGTKNDCIILKGHIFVKGRLPSLRLRTALEIAVIVCTIGPHLERKVTDLFRQGEKIRAVLLDGIGSAAVDALAQEACLIVRDAVKSRTYESSGPLMPGMPDFPISEQFTLCQIVHADKIGLRLSETAMMIPRKSISMIVGIGERMPTWTKAESCATCNLKNTCRYRVNV